MSHGTSSVSIGDQMKLDDVVETLRNMEFNLKLDGFEAEAVNEAIERLKSPVFVAGYEEQAHMNNIVVGAFSDVSLAASGLLKAKADPKHINMDDKYIYIVACKVDEVQKR